MSLLGVESLIYGADEPEACVRFYEDFGLEAERKGPFGADFRLAEGSSVLVRRNDDPALPPRFTNHPGAREVIWGVDSRASLDAVAEDLQRDRDVRIDADGTVHSADDAGIALGFRVFERRPVDAGVSEENTPSAVKRWDRHRKWFDRARPKVINHVVWGVPDIDAILSFYTKRLGFRVTDVSRKLGVFLRCDGRNEHHNLFLLETGRDIMWHHVCFAVENVDEMMAGANHMEARGWKQNRLGRHRIASALYYYLPNPAGGETEYGADTDYLTDAWKPRLWTPDFGNWFWYGRVPDDARGLPVWKVKTLEEPVERFHAFDDAAL